MLLRAKVNIPNRRAISYSAYEFMDKLISKFLWGEAHTNMFFFIFRTADFVFCISMTGGAETLYATKKAMYSRH
jgi:hypothetical protein